MPLDLATIEANITRAKADLDFWESAKKVLTDPRVASVLGTVDNLIPRGNIEQISLRITAPRSYGDVKKTVYSCLPDYGAQPYTSTEIVRTMEDRGFVFAAKHHGMAVNDALVALENEERALMVEKRGVAKLWTKAQSKQDQQQAPPVAGLM